MGISKTIQVDIDRNLPEKLTLDIHEITANELNSKQLRVTHDYNPAVYLFGDSESMYIGESKTPITRLLTHSKKRLNLVKDKIYLLSSNYMNASVIYNMETTLIDLLFASGDRTLRNSNLDQKLHNYFMSETYDKFIEPIWNHFNEIGITKKSYKELINEAEFKYSPYKKLNDEQLLASRSIIDNLSDGITMIKGLPGTGKSVLATSLFLELSKNQNVAITSTRDNSFANFNRVYKLLKSTLTTNSKAVRVKDLKKTPGEYDVVIIDEAHRLRRDDYGRGIPTIKVQLKKEGMKDELESLSKKYKKIIIMYDPNQSSHDNDIQNLESKYSDQIVAKHMLTEQMRSKDGMNYINWICEVLDGNESEYKSNKNYEVKFFDDFSELHRKLSEKITKWPLTRIVSGYTFEWASKKDDSKFDISLDGINLKWNVKAKDWLFSKGALDLQEAAYYDVILGLDLHYAGVIIGNDIKYRNGKIVCDIEAVPPSAKNQKPAKNIENFDEVFHDMVINRYKILLSRGAKGAYIFVQDEQLREYLKKLVIGGK